MVTYTFLQKAKVLFGAGCLNQAGEMCNQEGFKKAFIVCDAGIRATGMVDRLVDILNKSNVETLVFDKVQPNPPIKFVEEGSKICNEAGCDCVIGIGGGSNIDSAKGINVLRFNEPPVIRFGDPTEPMVKSPGLIVIPTTSGTGSEVSDGMILSDDNHKKITMLNPNLMSDFVILDPDLTAGMPPKLTSTTGLDALSHLIEAYMSTVANPFEYPLIEAALKLGVKYLPRAIENGKDIEARQYMCQVATMGGWMLGFGHAVGGHSFGHVVGAAFNIQHGFAVWGGLPYVCEFNAPVIPEKVKKIGELFGATFTGNETPEDIGAKTRDALIDFRDNKAKYPGLKSFGYDESKFEELSVKISEELLQNFQPRKMTPEVCLEVLKKAYA